VNPCCPADTDTRQIFLTEPDGARVELDFAGTSGVRSTQSAG